MIPPIPINRSLYPIFDCNLLLKAKIFFCLFYRANPKILNKIYSPKYYYERVMRFLKTFEPKKKKVFHLNPNYILALFRSIIKLGVIGEERIYYWKLFFWSLFRKPQLFSLAILFDMMRQEV